MKCSQFTALALALAAGVGLAQGLSPPPLGTTFRSLDRSTTEPDGTQTRLWISGQGRYQITRGSAQIEVLGDGHLEQAQLQRVGRLVTWLRAGEVATSTTPPIARIHDVTVDANGAVGGSFRGEAGQFAQSRVNQVMRSLDQLESTLLNATPPSPEPPSQPTPQPIPDGYRRMHGTVGTWISEVALEANGLDYVITPKSIAVQLGALQGQPVELVAKVVDPHGVAPKLEVLRLEHPAALQVFGTVARDGAGFELHVGPTYERQRVPLALGDVKLLERFLGHRVSLQGFQPTQPGPLQVTGIEARALPGARLSVFPSQYPLSAGSPLLLRGVDPFSRFEVLAGERSGTIRSGEIELVSGVEVVPPGLATVPVAAPHPECQGLTGALLPDPPAASEPPVAAEPLPANDETLSGRLGYTGGVSLFLSSGEVISLRGNAATALMQLEGLYDEQVKVQGHTTSSGDFHVSEVLSPKKVTVGGTYDASAGLLSVPGASIPLISPRIESLDGLRVIVEGWRPEGTLEVYTDGFKGYASSTTVFRIELSGGMTHDMNLDLGSELRIVGETTGGRYRVTYLGFTGTVVRTSVRTH